MDGVLKRFCLDDPSRFAYAHKVVAAVAIYVYRSNDRSGSIVGEFSVKWYENGFGTNVPIIEAPSFDGGWVALRLCADAIDALSVRIQCLPNPEETPLTPEDVCAILRSLGYQEDAADD